MHIYQTQSTITELVLLIPLAFILFKFRRRVPPSRVRVSATRRGVVLPKRGRCAQDGLHGCLWWYRCESWKSGILEIFAVLDSRDLYIFTYSQDLYRAKSTCRSSAGSPSCPACPSGQYSGLTVTFHRFPSTALTMCCRTYRRRLDLCHRERLHRILPLESPQLPCTKPWEQQVCLQLYR
jgi:hypothetical protein